MLFKNAIIYQLPGWSGTSFNLTVLNEALATHEAKLCGPHEMVSIGWVSPVSGGELSRRLGNTIIIRALIEKRVMPSSSVNDIVKKRVAEEEASGSYAVGKKRRTEIKEEVVFELMPKSLTTTETVFAYIDLDNARFIVDSSSAKKAEDVLSFLRKTLGSFPAVTIVTVDKMTYKMTAWIDNTGISSDNHCQLFPGDECELRSPEEGGGIIKCKNQDLSEPDVQEHILAGKKCHKLALTWDDKISFVVNDKFEIKKIKFLGMVQDQIQEIETDTEQDRFDADFSIMTGELAAMLADLINAFGGLVVQDNG